MVGGVLAQDHFGAGRFFEAEALVSNGDTAIVADFDLGAHTPDIRPPRANRNRAQDRTFFCEGRRPRLLRCLAQFPVHFLGVVVVTQGGEVLIGLREFGDFFAGEVGREATLPELMFAFDFALGLRRGGVAQADVIKLQGRAELRERIGRVGEEEAVVINVKLQWASVFAKGSRQEIEIGK